jgi:hypothetical protein
MKKYMKNMNVARVSNKIIAIMDPIMIIYGYIS